MKISIAVSGVEVVIEGITYTRRQVLDLLGEVAGVAIALEDSAPAAIEAAPSGFGFTLSADTELAHPDELDLSDYFEEEEEDQKLPG